ncbi:MAG: hypothetical protein QN173_08550 [Armatimonadota bacterium]|nr:hypothetical protein [Armatimonadota bacterium]MDR7402243.1 hypothetical protein [Armatimonadota bacterium]MDR7403371.1 hypothetical protein [Armatimonadota bacterium]MDR7437891.1 hypothetical protein [Armatimonadota bacterium]MDR7473295.1 hypothetical protein [Armatimonadota bacterium]
MTWRSLWVAGVVLTLATAAAALPADLTTFRNLYKPREDSPLGKAGCLICHTATPPTKEVNPYGADLAKQGKTRAEAAFRAIEKLDSDKDGFTNIAEIQAGTLPGDPTSRPAK